MFYICERCGHIFEDGEEAYQEEVLDWLDGVPVKEERSVCPVCGGDFDVAAECVCCGGHFHKDDLLPGGVCRECVNSSMTIDTLTEFANEDLDCYAEFIAYKSSKGAKR